MNDKKKLNLGLAMLPIVAMLLLLIIGYGQLGLRIEPLLLASAGVTAGTTSLIPSSPNWPKPCR